MEDNRLKLAIEALESGSYDKETIEYIFPELKDKESEDEKIRKALLEHIKGIKYFLGISKEQMIAWLEKQSKKSDYNPYKATVESIADMVNKYSNTDDLKDFYDNIKVKCKDAVEYDNTWLEKQNRKDSQVIHPKFTSDDILAIESCMQTMSKEEELYKQLKNLYGKLTDVYWGVRQVE